jgi:hypothetical protein
LIPIIPKDVFLRLWVEDNVGTIIDTFWRVFDKVAPVGPVAEVGRTINGKRARHSRILVCPKSRAVEIITTVEILKTAAVGVDDLPTQIATRLYVLDDYLLDLWLAGTGNDE